MRRLLPVLVLLLLPVLAWAQAQPTLPQSPLSIITADGKTHKFKVELAVTGDQMARGMMFRRTMAADAGMLFDYGRNTPGVAFWMKNTLIPLDMIFITAEGRILNVHERAIPHDESSVPAAGPVRAVLEVNGGTSARLGLKPGDRVVHAIFGGK